MNYLGRFSPVRAYRDLRFFLAGRERHELGFLAAAIAITGFFIWAFAHDSSIPREYHRDIIYVEQWRADRTDEEIRAQQKLDAPLKAKAVAEQKAREEKGRAQFKKVDEAMTR